MGVQPLPWGVFIENSKTQKLKNLNREFRQYHWTFPLSLSFRTHVRNLLTDEQKFFRQKNKRTYFALTGCKVVRL